jgi:hypothetical protein
MEKLKQVFRTDDLFPFGAESHWKNEIANAMAL